MTKTRTLSVRASLVSVSLGIAALVACSPASEDMDGSGGDGNLGTGGTAPMATGGTTASGGAVATGGTAASGGSVASGGTAGSGGLQSSGGESSSGGASSSGGESSSGGTSSSGGESSSGGAPNTPDRGPRECECETPAGEFGTVNSTIVVEAGQVYDGQCQIFRANAGTLGDGGQGEGQLPVFRVNSGGTLRNVVLGASAADGVHTYGDVTIENLHILDIGEDALTVKESGTVNIDCGSATNGDDKVFQVNAASTITISNFTASNAGKFMRQNGDTTFEINVTIDHSDISAMDEAIFRTDSSSSHVTLSNSRYSNIGDALFLFGSTEANGNSGQSTVSNNEEY